jgi:hypothetical protein
MIKLLIKLAIAGLIANGSWRLGNAYLAHYQFTDDVRRSVTVPTQSDAELRTRILELASKHSLPLEEDGFTTRREQRHVFVAGSYTKPIELVPGYVRPWAFKWDVDGFIIDTKVY